MSLIICKIPKNYNYTKCNKVTAAASHLKPKAILKIAFEILKALLR